MAAVFLENNKKAACAKLLSTDWFVFIPVWRQDKVEVSSTFSRDKKDTNIFPKIIQIYELRMLTWQFFLFLYRSRLQTDKWKSTLRALRHYYFSFRHTWSTAHCLWCRMATFSRATIYMVTTFLKIPGNSWNIYFVLDIPGNSWNWPWL